MVHTTGASGPTVELHSCSCASRPFPCSLLPGDLNEFSCNNNGPNNGPSPDPSLNPWALDSRTRFALIMFIANLPLLNFGVCLNFHWWDFTWNPPYVWLPTHNWYPSRDIPHVCQPLPASLLIDLGVALLWRLLQPGLLLLAVFFPGANAQAFKPILCSFGTPTPNKRFFVEPFFPLIGFFPYGVLSFPCNRRESLKVSMSHFGLDSLLGFGRAWQQVTGLVSAVMTGRLGPFSNPNL